QRDVANGVLVTLSSSAMMTPNFWLNPQNEVSYPLVVQTPQYRVDSMPELMTLPLAANANSNAAREKQLLMNVARVSRGQVPMMISQLNIRPVFDVHADVQGRDLASAAAAIDKVVKANQPDARENVHIDVTGQVETMHQSFAGLFGGMGLAV